MKKTITFNITAFLMLISCTTLLADDSAVLFDFEKSQDAKALKVWNSDKTKVSLSTTWAKRGKSSLRVEAQKYVKGKMAPQYYPGVAWVKERISVRDWSKYKYLTFDVKCLQDNTPFSILVQRGARRLDRVDAFFKLPKGEFRLWINIPKKIAGGNDDLSNIKNIMGVEFHMTRTPNHTVVYIDNICLRKKFDSISAVNRKKVNIKTAVLKLRKSSKGQRREIQMDYMENTSPSESEKLQEKADLLKSLQKKLAGQAADVERTQTILEKYKSYQYAVMVAPPEDQIFFKHQPVQKFWKNTVEIGMLRGECRSKQLVIFPMPGKELKKISINASDLTCKPTGKKISKANVSFEMIGYVKLPEYESGKYFESGWYPDPIIKLRQPFNITAPRQVQPILLTIKVPRDSQAGEYCATISVCPEGKKKFELPVRIDVSNLSIPKSPQMPQILGMDAHQGYKDPDFWLDLRINPHYHDMGNMYQSCRKGPMPIEQVKEHCDKGMNKFNLKRISGLFMDEWAPTDGAMQKYLEDIYRLYSDEYMEKLQALGLSDKAVFYGFDEYTIDGEGCEVKRHRLKTIFSALKKRYGKYGVKIATSAQTWSGAGNLELPVDIWISGVGVHDPVKARVVRRTKKDVEIWWYTIRWDLGYHPAFSRAIPWATYGNDAQGWMVYNVNAAWNKAGQKLGDKPLTEWYPLCGGHWGFFGTGSLVYTDSMGKMRPSLRLINFREGLYDYDLLSMLKDEVSRLEKISDKLTFDQQVTLERAKELTIAKPWKQLFDEYVSSYQVKKMESLIIPQISSMRNKSFVLLQELSKIKE